MAHRPHVVQVNAVYDPQLRTPDALLDRYATPTDWSTAIAGGGASVSAVQRFSADAKVVRDGIRYEFVKDDQPPWMSVPDFRSGLRRAGTAWLERVLALGIAPAAERLARKIYGWHLRRRSATWRSIDQVRLGPECLKLHTSSHRADTLARFDAAMNAAQEQSKETTQTLAS